MNDAGRIGFVIRGNYDNTTTYDFLDVVYYENASYVAKKLTIGNEPEENNEYWQILATSPNNAVIGIKGAAEENFRTGNVIISPKNIGLGNVENTPDSEKEVLSAKKLSVNTNTGSNINPIYFKNGLPVQCSYSLEKSVPKNAIFTDTTYTSLKNPCAITFTGNSNESYDGSSSKTVAIPKYMQDELFLGELRFNDDNTNNIVETIVSFPLEDYFMFEIEDSNNNAYLIPNVFNTSLEMNTIEINESYVVLKSMNVLISNTEKKFKFFSDGIGMMRVGGEYVACDVTSYPKHYIKKICGYKFT